MSTKRFGLKIPTQNAEKIHTTLVDLDLLDNQYHILKTEKMSVVFPLTHTPSLQNWEALKQKGVSQDQVDEFVFKHRENTIRNLKEAFSTFLPSHLMPLIPRSMDIIGDLAIIELNPSLEPYEASIGNIILSVHRNLQGVFSKQGAISGDRRVRKLKAIAGVKETCTIHKENHCRLYVDIRETYYSPRLSTERLRVMERIPGNSMVLDMFAGVGPYSILAAKKGCQVFAVDINPIATSLLEKNAILNNVSHQVQVYTGDIRQIIPQQKWNNIDHVIMNLPGSAIDFIGLAIKVLKKKGGVIHYYCFKPEPNPEEQAIHELDTVLSSLSCSEISISQVRRVKMAAPREWQIGLEVTFQKSTNPAGQ